MSSIFPEEELTNLLEKRGEICISIYMSTRELGRDKRKLPIRLKNLLRETEAILRETDMRAVSVQDLLRPASELSEDNTLWRESSGGLAVFITPGWFRRFLLPLEFENRAIVSDRFHIKPLLPLFAEDHEYRVLALSQNHIALYSGTPFDLNEISLEKVPTSMDEALKYEDSERQLQFHTKTTSAGGPGKRSAVFHGQGTGIDDSKDKILRFFRAVSKGIQPLLAKSGKPLVLAGVEYLQPIYRVANDYPFLLDAGLTGNPEKMSIGQMHEKSWAVAKEYFSKKRKAEIARYEEMRGTGLAIDDAEDIARAAREGRIDTLFLETGCRQWGHIDSESQTVELHAKRQIGDADLTDFAAVHTYLKNGKVISAPSDEISGIEGCAALLRY